jgi:hypothetical protein
MSSAASHDHWSVPETGAVKIGGHRIQVEVLVDGRLHNYQYCLQCAEHNHDSWGRRAIERQGRLREWCQCSQVGSKLDGARGEISLRSQIGDRCGESRHSASVPCAGAGRRIRPNRVAIYMPLSPSGALIAIAS